MIFPTSAGKSWRKTSNDTMHKVGYWYSDGKAAIRTAMFDSAPLKRAEDTSIP